MTRLIKSPPPGLRERPRADGTTRIWWEPSAAARALGFASVELDARRLTWSVREATRLNAEAVAAQKIGRRPAPNPGGRSISALIDNLRRSRAFQRRAEKTRDSYLKQFALIDRKWGPHAVADFSKPVMHEWYETLLDSAGPATALARIRHMSMLMAHAELIGWRPEGSNPCSRLKMQTPAGRRHVVSWAAVDALIAAADRLGLPSMATAIAVGMFQGQRQTDIRLACVGAFSQIEAQMPGWPAPRKVWVWRFTRSKRGNDGAMILHDEALPHVLAAIEAAKARLRARNTPAHLWARSLAAEPLLWDDRLDRPFHGQSGEYAFQTRWGAVKAAAIEAATAAQDDALAANLAPTQFRDLRRSFGVLARAGGASKDDTADVLGNSAATDQHLADIYMAPTFETASRAVLAMQRPKPERKKA